MKLKKDYHNMVRHEISKLKKDANDGSFIVDNTVTHSKNSKSPERYSINQISS